MAQKTTVSTNLYQVEQLSISCPVVFRCADEVCVCVCVYVVCVCVLSKGRVSRNVTLAVQNKILFL